MDPQKFNQITPLIQFNYNNIKFMNWSIFNATVFFFPVLLSSKSGLKATIVLQQNLYIFYKWSNGNLIKMI